MSRYGPQDWDLLPGIWHPGADPRVWKHKACGERLEFPDDEHLCRVVIGVDPAKPGEDRTVHDAAGGPAARAGDPCRGCVGQLAPRNCPRATPKCCHLPTLL